MKNIKEKLIISGIIVSLILSIAGIYSFIKTNDGEWVCISQRCISYAEGDEWVKQNCKLEVNTMICEFAYQGQNFRVPLSGVNVSAMISCAEYECDSEVFVRRSKQ